VISSDPFSRVIEALTATGPNPGEPAKWSRAFFSHETIESVAAAIQACDALENSPEEIAERVRAKFSPAVFAEQMSTVVSATSDPVSEKSRSNCWPDLGSRSSLLARQPDTPPGGWRGIPCRFLHCRFPANLAEVPREIPFGSLSSIHETARWRLSPTVPAGSVQGIGNLQAKLDVNHLAPGLPTTSKKVVLSDE
jgi:hypothetical protein